MDNREKILDVALKLFTTKGYDAVGVQEVADRAGITKPTLYHYFGSKYGLLEELVRTYYVKFADRLKADAVYDGDLPLTLQRFVLSYFVQVSQNKDFFRLFMSMLYSGDDSDTYKVVCPYAEQHMNMITSMFASAGNQVGNMNGRQQQYAITFTGMIHHWLLLWLSTDNPEMINEGQAYGLVHQFLHGIYV